MSKRQQMPSVRRPMPGMTGTTPVPPPPKPKDTERPGVSPVNAPPHAEQRQRRPATDYSTTRLVNFRIPVDLHDRYRQLVQETEREHPRLRKPSLTELVIAMLEEGPQTIGEVAELIRRKRAAEHEED